MAAESGIHLWDINGVEIESNYDAEYTIPFDEQFKKLYQLICFCAWAWIKTPDKDDLKYFKENNFPDEGKGYGILYLYDPESDVIRVPVLPSQEEEVAEWLKPKFPYPASVLKKQKAEKKEK